MNAPSAVVDYDPAWPDQFCQLRDNVAPVLRGIGVVVIEHVGSTAVPGLAAKPIIDIDVVVAVAAVIPAVIVRLESVGYKHRGNLGIKGREAFTSPIGLPYHHMYVVARDSKPHLDHVQFRDYLRRHLAVAHQYGALKKSLEPLLRRDRVAYTEAKAGFIEDVLARVRIGTR